MGKRRAECDSAAASLVAAKAAQVQGREAASANNDMLVHSPKTQAGWNTKSPNKAV